MITEGCFMISKLSKFKSKNLVISVAKNTRSFLLVKPMQKVVNLKKMN